MTTVSIKQLDHYLSCTKTKEALQLYLIYGEEFLRKQVLEKIINFIMHDAVNTLAIEIFDENIDNIKKAFYSINTFSLLQNGKIIILHNSELFKLSKQNSKLLSVLPTSATCKKNTNNENVLFKKTLHSCEEMNVETTKKDTGSQFEEYFIEKGFPNNHYMILMSDTVDKNTSIFKTIKNKGLVVDCFVPKIKKYSAKIIQESVLHEIVSKILDENKKTMTADAYKILVNITEFDLNIFSNNLNKLIDYVGRKKKITSDDVKVVLQKTKKDHLFDLTNAIAEKKITQSLFFLNSLLSNNVHPLQILTAIANSIRSLIIAKHFILNDKNKNWNSKQTFNYFKLNTISAIKKYDIYLENKHNYWHEILEFTKLDTSLLLLGKKNDYSVYKTILKADDLEENLLLDTVNVINKADNKLKSANYNARIVLESVIFFVCRS